MNYKEIFQLAQDKGYTSEITWLSFPTLEMYHLVELTLIQKWLRDKHKIIVDVSFDKGIGNTAPTFYCRIYKGTRDTAKDVPDAAAYEQALLEGIAEALKLI